MWEACTHRIDASPYPTHGDDFPMMRVPRTHASRLVFHLMPYGDGRLSCRAFQKSKASIPTSIGRSSCIFSPIEYTDSNSSSIDLS
jgi:hypothetical protein